MKRNDFFLEGKMKNKPALKERLTGKLFSGAISLLLMFSLTASAWATIFTNSGTITLPDATAICPAAPYPASQIVGGMTGNITNITVGIYNITSTFPDDVDILLVAPGGNNLII